MKITDLLIEDRRTRGEYVEPVAVARVDEPVEEMGTPIKYGQYWRKIPCGPFVAVEHCEVLGEWDDAQRHKLAEFNTLGYHHEQLAPVVVVHPEEPRIWLMMGVKRLRRLMRQHTPDYTIMVDEVSAHNGRLNWRIELKTPVCFARGCGVAPVESTWYGGAHVNLCPTHLAEHNDMLRRKSYAGGSKIRYGDHS